jgi:hypothetical protein
MSARCPSSGKRSTGSFPDPRRSLTTICGGPRCRMMVSSSRTTRWLDSDESARSARHSRVKSSTITSTRKRRPSTVGQRRSRRSSAGSAPVARSSAPASRARACARPAGTPSAAPRDRAGTASYDSAGCRPTAAGCAAAESRTAAADPPRSSAAPGSLDPEGASGRIAVADLCRKHRNDLLFAEPALLHLRLLPTESNSNRRRFRGNVRGNVNDCRVVRSLVFGRGEVRTLADFRRSGALEALAGGGQAKHLSAKMANTLSASNALHKTYTPVELSSVRAADAARLKGRRLLQENK